jgi:hypothetical protein
MRPRKAYAISFVALVGLSLGVSNASAQCLEYEPAVSTLRGLLVRATFPGPPTFESVRTGDAPESTWLLSLDSEICVTARDDINVETGNQKSIQLVLIGDSFDKYRALLGQRVTVVGTLFHAHTGHHHTNLLLETKDIRLESLR